MCTKESQILKHLATVSQDVPGMSVYVFSKRDEIRLFQSYGYEDLETKKPITRASKWCVQSISKNIAATTAAWLVGKGKTTYDANIHDQLPCVSFCNEYFNGINDARTGLSHTTGLQGSSGASAAILWLPLGRIYKTVKYQALMTTPGTFQYSNLGITLGFNAMSSQAGYQCPNIPINEFTSLLGMKCFVYPPNERIDLNGAVVTPYFKDGCSYVKDLVPRMRQYTAADGVVGTIDDMAKFVDFHLDKTQTLIPRETLDEIYKPIVPTAGVFNQGTYGMGTSISYFLIGGKKFTVYGHAGGYSDGYAHQMLYDIENDIGIVILTNTFSETATASSYYIYLLLVASQSYATDTYASILSNIRGEVSSFETTVPFAYPTVPLSKLVGKYFCQNTGYAKIYISDDDDNCSCNCGEDGYGKYMLKIGKAEPGIISLPTNGRPYIYASVDTSDGIENMQIYPIIDCGNLIGIYIYVIGLETYIRVK